MELGENELFRNLQAENARLRKLVREMTPMVKSIADIDGTGLRRFAEELLSRPEVRAIMGEKGVENVQ